MESVSDLVEMLHIRLQAEQLVRFEVKSMPDQRVFASVFMYATGRKVSKGTDI